MLIEFGLENYASFKDQAIFQRKQAKGFENTRVQILLNQMMFLY